MFLFLGKYDYAHKFKCIKFSMLNAMVVYNKGLILFMVFLVLFMFFGLIIYMFPAISSCFLCGLGF